MRKDTSCLSRLKCSQVLVTHQNKLKHKKNQLSRSQVDVLSLRVIKEVNQALVRHLHLNIIVLNLITFSPHKMNQIKKRENQKDKLKTKESNQNSNLKSNRKIIVMKRLTLTKMKQILKTKILILLKSTKLYQNPQAHLNRLKL